MVYLSESSDVNKESKASTEIVTIPPGVATEEEKPTKSVPVSISAKKGEDAADHKEVAPSKESHSEPPPDSVQTDNVKTEAETAPNKPVDESDAHASLSTKPSKAVTEPPDETDQGMEAPEKNQKKNNKSNWRKFPPMRRK